MVAVKKKTPAPVTPKPIALPAPETSYAVRKSRRSARPPAGPPVEPEVPEELVWLDKAEEEDKLQKNYQPPENQWVRATTYAKPKAKSKPDKKSLLPNADSKLNVPSATDLQDKEVAQDKDKPAAKVKPPPMNHPKGPIQKPENVRQSTMDLMHWHWNDNDDSKDKPKFAKKKSNKPFYMRRHHHYRREWQIPFEETTSHWLSGKWIHNKKNDKRLRAHRVINRPIDRGNLQSRWTKARKAEDKEKFGVSKYGVPVKGFEKDKQMQHQFARVDFYRDRDDKGVIHTYTKMLDPNVKFRDVDDTTPMDNPENVYKRPSERSDSDPELDEDSSDPYLDDPSRFFKDNKIIKLEAPKEEEEPPKPKPRKPKVQPEPAPPPPPPELKPIPPPPRKRRPTPTIDVSKNYDFIFFNARRASIMPPRRPVPIYVDDIRGTRHKYCSSGLARVFVFKPEFGKIPEYLQNRNKELGRPPIPDFRKFYQPHVCKYVYGHTHCHKCNKRNPCHYYADHFCGDPFIPQKDRNCTTRADKALAMAIRKCQEDKLRLPKFTSHVSNSSKSRSGHRHHHNQNFTSTSHFSNSTKSKTKHPHNPHHLKLPKLASHVSNSTKSKNGHPRPPHLNLKLPKLTSHASSSKSKSKHRRYQKHVKQDFYSS